MCSNQDHTELFTIISKLTTLEETENFFVDLCSPSELDAFSQRIKSAKMLINGETYENIIKETGISSATLSRISKCVKQGKGYSKHL
jgi:TrpR-related protein YerC/YecD